jgi:hypothetical protein
MIYYEHYSQLALIGNWVTCTGDGHYMLDKWVVGRTRCSKLHYDGNAVKLQIVDMAEFSDVIGEPTEDYIVYTVLSASLALSELW